MILIHACCAPCVSPILDELNDYHVFWYNPNIHPYREYLRRLDTLKKLRDEKGFELIIDPEYDIQKWLEKAIVLNKKNDVLRCRFCYADRLEKTARYAKEHGYDSFTSSLLYSPYQKHELIKEIGESLSKKFDINFYYRDFRDLYPKGDEIAKRYGLYRQGYCGCIFSEFDRYGGRDNENKD